MSHYSAPQNYPRRILLSVTGLSPQVITETLYALAVEQKPPFLPTEIHLLTTREGAERARLALLNPKTGRFHAFCRDYGIAPGAIHFTEQEIHVVEGEGRAELSDIRTADDNRAAADFITRHLAQLAEDAESALHVSIAGGRKTMGFYLGYALSLYGREQDRLSHVLVNAPFESEPQFYYPPPEPEVIDLARENRPASTADATITLAEIPFVRMRHGISTAAGTVGFGETIRQVQNSLGPPRLQFDYAQRKIWVGGVQLAIKPVDAAYYLWLATRVVRGEPPIHWSEAEPEPFLAVYRRLVSDYSGDYERTEEALRRNGLSADFASERKSRVQKALRNTLGRDEATPYLIENFGSRPLTRHGLKLTAEQIHLHYTPEDPPGEESSNNKIVAK